MIHPVVGLRTALTRYLSATTICDIGKYASFMYGVAKVMEDDYGRVLLGAAAFGIFSFFSRTAHANLVFSQSIYMDHAIQINDIVKENRKKLHSGVDSGLEDIAKED